ncbi:hypothetical protein DM558_04625 [Entomomonas moraniae]|uniref:LysR substrate-binding domain-containing protein n=1 Tax=Entomomonas moraniae TaxID=2213226 RepID=A0A3S9XCB0_9GAMM|nr:hypothetical protein DM558_04625 [Entomomonas moraniae]
MLHYLLIFLSNYPKIKIEAYYEDSAVNIVAKSYDLVIRIGFFSNSNLISKKLGVFKSPFLVLSNYLLKHGMKFKLFFIINVFSSE